MLLKTQRSCSLSSMNVIVGGISSYEAYPLTITFIELRLQLRSVLISNYSFFLGGGFNGSRLIVEIRHTPGLVVRFVFCGPLVRLVFCGLIVFTHLHGFFLTRPQNARLRTRNAETSATALI